MLHYSANGWQAVLFALLAGLEAGALLMAAGWLRRRVPRALWLVSDALCAAGMAALFARALWQGTEGVLRPFMLACFALGLGIFRAGPGSAAKLLAARLRRAKVSGIIKRFR